jgi:thioredoxin 1
MSESKNVIEVTDSNFDQTVLKSPIPTLVDFWAEWCGPCRLLAPTIDALAAQYEGKLKICKVNVDLNPTVPTQYKIRGIPTLLLFSQGKLVEQLVGNQSKETIIETIQKHI